MKGTPKMEGYALRWSKQVLTFGVSVGVGLAPLLGMVGVPGFSQLIELFPQLPNDNRTQLIAVSAFLMGITALACQYYASMRISLRQSRRIFGGVLVALLLMIFGMFVTHQYSVVDAGVHKVVVGFSAPICEECKGKRRSECLLMINSRPDTIERCFGDHGPRNAQTALGLLYLLSLMSLGGLVGFSLRQTDQARKKHKTPTKR